MGLKKRPYNDKSDKPKRSGDASKKTSKGGGAKGFSAKKSGGFGDDKKRSFSKTGDKKTGSFGKDKRSFDDKPKRSYGKTSSGDRPSRPTGKPSFSKREGDSFDDRPKRSFGKPSSGERSSRPSYGKRDSSSFDERPKRSYGKPSSGDRPSRPSGRPSYNKREDDLFDDKPKRTYGKSSSGDRPSRPSGRPSYNKREEGSGDRPKRSYTRSNSRDENDRKPREYKGGGRPSRDEKPARSTRVGKEDSYKTRTRLRKEKPEEPNDDPALMEEIRLNRYISNAGVCSRREADELIGAGLVSVNGEIITEMGYKVKPGDEIRYNNERLSWEKKVYLLMNKPKDSITTADDPEGRRTVMDLINDPKLPRVYPVGRLDRNTTGVLLLTNDGELAQRMMHPKYLVTKVYKATLNKNLHGEDLWKLQNGVELEDGFIKPDAVAVMDAKAKNEVMVQIHSGRNRIIHRIFESLGYTLDKLDRIQYADLEKKGLGRSIWRHLTDKELKKLKKLVNLK